MLVLFRGNLNDRRVSYLVSFNAWFSACWVRHRCYQLDMMRRALAPGLERLVGVYHADGGLRGELAYVWGKIRGTAHCALCDITHAGVREKASFRRCRGAFSVPFDTVHLNEQSPDLARFTKNRTPCVVGQFAGKWRMLLSAEQLEVCARNVTQFEALLREAVESIVEA